MSFDAVSSETMPQAPLRLPRGGAVRLATQFAALPYRIGPEGPDRVEVCLVTSRGRKAWILPKGWPMHGKTPAETAAQEAWEEAGLRGHGSDRAIGLFSYSKRRGKLRLPCLALVFPVRVTMAHDFWPERSQRRRKWFTPAQAADKLASPELRQMLRDFAPTGPDF